MKRSAPTGSGHRSAFRLGRDPGRTRTGGGAGAGQGWGRAPQVGGVPAACRSNTTPDLRAPRALCAGPEVEAQAAMALRAALFDLYGVLALPSLAGAFSHAEEELALPR